MGLIVFAILAMMAVAGLSLGYRALRTQLHLVGCLDADARATVAEMAALGARLADGKVDLVVPGMLEDATALLRIVRAMVGTARAIGAIELAAALARNAQRDPEEGVRLRNLELLVRHLPSTDPTRAALAAAARDRSPRMRQLAASLAPIAGG